MTGLRTRRYAGAFFVVDSDCFCGRCFPEYGTDSGRCYFSELHQLAGQRYLLLAALLLVGVSGQNVREGLTFYP